MYACSFENNYVFWLTGEPRIKRFYIHIYIYIEMYAYVHIIIETLATDWQ